MGYLALWEPGRCYGWLIIRLSMFGTKNTLLYDHISITQIHGRPHVAATLGSITILRQDQIITIICNLLDSGRRLQKVMFDNILSDHDGCRRHIAKQTLAH